MKQFYKLLLIKTLDKFGGVSKLERLLKEKGMSASKQLLWNNCNLGKIPLERAFKMARMLKIHPALLNFEGAELILDKKFSIPKLIEGSGFSDVTKAELYEEYNKVKDEKGDPDEDDDSSELPVM